MTVVYCCLSHFEKHLLIVCFSIRNIGIKKKLERKAGDYEKEIAFIKMRSLGNAKSRRGI